MKAKIRKWTYEDGVTKIDTMLFTIYPSIPAARKAAAEMRKADPECAEDMQKMTSARKTTYCVIDANGGRRS